MRVDAKEEVWLERGNIIEWVVLEDDVPVSDLSSLTRAVVCVDEVVVDSAVEGSSVIWWTDSVTGKTLACVEDAYTGDVLRAKLGGVTGLTAGEYDDCRVITFDAQNPSGIVVSDNIEITVYDACL